MDWRTVRFDWNRARAFLVTAEEGSLSAAARALGLAQPTLGRQIEALQQELGVVLFERVGRGLTLTPNGLDLVEHVRAMGEAASRMSLVASGRSQTLEGPISISASEVYAAFLLPPIIAKLRRAEPGITIEIVATNTPSDLQRREADIAIRSFRPTQAELIARHVRDDSGRLYASAAYLDRIGNPSASDDLTGVDFIGWDRTDALIGYLKKLGLNLTQEHFPIVTANQLVQWQLVKQDAGIAVMTEDIGDNEPLVRRAFPELDPVAIPIWLTTHREVGTSKRVRYVFDLLAEALKRVQPRAITRPARPASSSGGAFR
ncbi:MAG: LysR family transcriptional regulator [Bauldia sp.]|nr:LysR family transcriptional regulator [Bauldia sp.]